MVATTGKSPEQQPQTPASPVAEKKTVKVSPSAEQNFNLPAKDHPDAYWKGWLKKRHLGTHGTKRRYCIVKPTCLMYFASPDVRSLFSFIQQLYLYIH
jgi:hypothetical protein